MKNFSRPLALLLASCLFLEPLYPFGFSSAAAQEIVGRPTVAVVGFRTNNSQIERQARSYLSEVLRDSKRMVVLPDDAVGKKVDAVWEEESREAYTTLEKAKESYLNGRKLYENLQVDEAIAAFNVAARGYRQGIAALKENRYLLVSHLYLGMALIVRGRVQEGREYLRQMIALNPNRKGQKLPESEFPPKIVRAHEELTNEVLNGPSGTLMVTSTPRSALVYFDGVPQIASPMEIRDVPVGEHFLVAELRGYRRWTKRIVVKPGTNQEDVKMDPWQPVAPYVSCDKRRDIKTNETLIHVGDQIGAQILVLAYLEETSSDNVVMMSQMYDTRSREFSKVEVENAPRGKIRKAAARLGEKTLGNLAVGGNIVMDTCSPMALPTPTPEGTTYVRETSSDPFYNKWWFWTIIGVAAIGGGAYAISSSRSSPNYNVLDVKNPLQ